MDGSAPSTIPPMRGQPPAPLGPAIHATHWRLVWGVVALQAALHLGWIVYRAHQPLLLRTFGFPGLLLPFALLPGVLGLLTEPIGGALSDRWAARARGRLLPITVAVSTAGLIFLAAAGVVHQSLTAIGIMLPALMVVWLMAVQAASSPTLALLNEAAPSTPCRGRWPC